MLIDEHYENETVEDFGEDGVIDLFMEADDYDIWCYGITEF